MNSFIRKLGLRATFDDQDIEALQGATDKTFQVDAARELVLAGERSESAYIILDGFACRYKIVPGGGRSIIAYLVPGDACDLHASILNRLIHSVSTLTSCTVAIVPYSIIRELAASRPNIYTALWWSIIVDEAILQEWLVGVGRRSADKQVAHFLCEILVRLQAIGVGDEYKQKIPLTHSILADTAGLSHIHIYRVLSNLRKKGLIQGGRGTILVPDLDRLKEFAGFVPDYLYFSEKKSQLTEI